MQVNKTEYEQFEITDIQGLDPVRVFLRDAGQTRPREYEGKLVIECFGQAFAASWNSMYRPIKAFITGSEADYVAGCLTRGNQDADFGYVIRIVKAVQYALLSQESVNAR